MSRPTRKKPKPGQGRKSEGRVRRNVMMKPEGWALIEAELRGKGDSIGRVIERKYRLE